MRRRSLIAGKEADELDLTAMINIMVILVCFLLVTAVFSRIMVLELNLPPAQSASAGDSSPKKEFNLEVIVRKNALELNDRSGSFFQRLDNRADGYDMPALEQQLRQLKARFSEMRNASILLEQDIPYDTLVKVMDAVREESSTDPNIRPPELFPDISIGDAPPENRKKK